ncbi:hypothetical protein [Candidatus Palauibacter sp.]|uniref:hypothetical protein n=1 Tax=Candidatus Palauibacter sp. TaxID=3101350 RepID=UPI003AF22F70
MSVTRPVKGRLGRYRDENREFRGEAFEGEIASKSKMSKWSVVGIQSLGSESLHDLRSQPDWPQFLDSRNGRHTTVPRKALAHAAVTVLRPVGRDANRFGMRLRWAAFFPLDDHPAPSPSPIVESDGPSPAWEVILHGYFWPSQDRKSIPGVTDEGGDATSDGDMRSRWNRTLCEDLLLPLLPSALAKAVDGVNEHAARRLLGAVARSDMVKDRLPFVRRRHWLLPIASPDRVQWEARDADRCPVLSIPNWSQAPEAVRTRFLASCREYMGHVVFIDDGAPRLAGELDDWAVEHLECLLNSIPVDAFASQQSLRWIEGVVSHVLGPDARAEDVRAAAFVQWLAGQIGDGVLAPTIRSASRETQDELREAWRGLCAAIPRAWLVEAPVGTLRAVVDLAVGGGVIGEGLFLLPVGRRPDDSRPTRNRDQEPLDRALTALGQRLEAGGESERMRNSRLLLAETLLSIRPYCPAVPPLSELPFLRAISLPEDKQEAWRIADLRHQIGNHRVFASPVSGDPEDVTTNGTQPERTSDPKRAATDLAMALDETVWWVDGDAVASVATEVPSPEPKALARAVLQADTFAEAASRTPLLRRLASNISGDADLRLAGRALLAGCTADVVGCDTELFHVRASHERALLILLHLLDRSWCAIDRRLASSLSQDTLEALAVDQADLEALHRLLDDCLDRSVDWMSLNDGEALHLLQRLYGAEPEAQRRWRTMPLHRAADGKRVAFDDRARLSTGRTSEFVLPPELRADVCLLDPDPDVAHLYDAVPDMDRDGILQLMVDALDADRVAQVHDGHWLIMPEPGLVDTSLIATALKTTLAGSHPGWKLVHSVRHILEQGDSQPRDDSKLLLKLAKSLCAPVPLERQIEMLERLAASRPAKDSPGGRMFRRLLGCFAETVGFFEVPRCFMWVV